MTDVENYHDWRRDARTREKQAEDMLINGEARQQLS